MDMNTYNKREKMLRLREELLTVEENRLYGEMRYSIDEVISKMKKVVEENSNG